MNIFVLKTNIAHYEVALKLNMDAPKARRDREIASRSEPGTCAGRSNVARHAPALIWIIPLMLIIVHQRRA